MYVSGDGTKISGKEPKVILYDLRRLKPGERDAWMTRAINYYVTCRDNAERAKGLASRYSPGTASHDRHNQKSWAWGELAEIWIDRIREVLADGVGQP